MKAQSRIERWALVLASVVVVLAGLSLRAAFSPGRIASGVADLIEPATAAQVGSSVTFVRLKGKKLTVTGLNFADGAVIWVDGVAQETKNDSGSPGSVLIAKKAGKKILRDSIARLWVRNPDGALSEELSFYTGCSSQ